MEVVTVGRRIDYLEFFKMCKKIIDESVKRGAYVNQSCSIHMHVLAANYSKLFDQQEKLGIPKKVSELEREMPEIILANFHQLCRRYQNAITWLTMGLDDPERMTRWEKFRVSVLEISPVVASMSEVKEKVRVHAGGNKYGWVNYNFVDFGNSGDVSRLHIELRTMDGILSPSIVASVACLYYALMIKAVEISKYGLLEVGDKAWMDQAKQAKKAILNNMKDYKEGDRWGSTKNIMKYRDVYIRESI